MRLIVFVFYGMRLSCSHLMYFVLPKGFFISLKINIYAFLGYFIFFLLVFCKVMQKARHFILLIYCGAGESVTSPHSFMNAEVLLYLKH